MYVYVHVCVCVCEVREEEGEGGVRRRGGARPVLYAPVSCT